MRTLLRRDAAEVRPERWDALGALAIWVLPELVIWGLAIFLIAAL